MKLDRTELEVPMMPRLLLNSLRFSTPSVLTSSPPKICAACAQREEWRGEEWRGRNARQWEGWYPAGTDCEATMQTRPVNSSQWTPLLHTRSLELPPAPSPALLPSSPSSTLSTSSEPSCSEALLFRTACSSPFVSRSALPPPSPCPRHLPPLPLPPSLSMSGLLGRSPRGGRRRPCLHTCS